MKTYKKPVKAWVLVSVDIALTAALLLVFAYFHHVRQGSGVAAVAVMPTATATVSAPTPGIDPTASPIAEITASPVAEATAQATASPIAEATASPTPAPVDEVGSFAYKYADKFISGEPVISDDGTTCSYVSENINVTLSTLRYTDGSDTADVYVADIYLKNIKSFVCGFGYDTYGDGYREWLEDISSRYSAVVAINGDYYSSRKYGAVIRNGVVYRTLHSSLDACVLYNDGTMKVFDPKDFNAETEIANGAWQVWNFGPRLLTDDGQPMTEFNSNLGKHNPRTAIGYYEPGHYCFVVVDGRTSTSNGLKLTGLSKLMYDLGCTAAFNLDGGQTSSMTWLSSVVNIPDKDGRKIPDNVMILDIGG